MNSHGTTVGLEMSVMLFVALVMMSLLTMIFVPLVLRLFFT